MSVIQKRGGFFALAAGLFAAFAASTQAIVVPWAGTTNSNWLTPGAWPASANGVNPQAINDEAAAINNGNTVIINSAITGTLQPAGVILGQAAANTGTLQINAGGTLATENIGLTETGAVVVGQAGTGTLTVASGGALNPLGLVVGRDGGSVGTVNLQNGSTTNVPNTIQVGQGGRGTLNVLGGATMTAGRLNTGGATGATATLLALGDATALTATVTSNGPTSLNRTTQVNGANVNFTSVGPLTLGPQHTLFANIQGATHSALKSNAAASVNGNLRLQIAGGAPALGTTWNLVNATSINGNFGAIDATAAPALPLGQAYQTRRVAGGNGQLLQVGVEQMLTLQVHRNSGALTLRNTGAAVAAANIPLDGYTIVSANGGLNAGVPWNSLTDQAVGGWTEVPQAPNALSEYNAGGSLTLAGGQTRGLGTPYTQIYTSFRSNPDDISFTYNTANGLRTGIVEYVGTQSQANNFVLTVNARTGAATLKNDSPFNVGFEGYSIFSPAGSLRPGVGQWNSLADQGTPNITEAAPTTTVLSELTTSATLVTLNANSTRTLGTLFNPASARDLTFEFLLPTEGDGVAGVVRYMSADFNNNGSVEATDLTNWRASYRVNAGGDADGDGDTDGNDLMQWQQQLGMSMSVPATTAVPEPAGWLLAMMGGALALRRSRRSARSTPTNIPQRSPEMQPSYARPRCGRSLALAVAACLPLVGSSLARGADILLVTRPSALGASDQELISLLKSFNHTIVNEANVATNNASFITAPPTAAQLVGVDMILFTRNNSSGDFIDGAGEVVGWNSISTPMVLMSPQLIRGGPIGTANGNNRLGWVNSTAIIDNQAAPTDLDAFPNASHPFVNGRSTSIFPAGQSIDLLNFTAAELPTGATLVATMTVGANTFPSIVDIPAGTPLFGDDDGVSTNAGGRRAFFQMSEYPDTTDVFALSTNGGQILNQIVTTLGGAASSRPGDVDGDGDVDPIDLNTIRTNWRTAVSNRTQGDLNGDSFVDLIDFRIWKENDPLAAGAAGGVVPEPTGLALASLGLGWLARWRRRRAPSAQDPKTSLEGTPMTDTSTRLAAARRARPAATALALAALALCGGLSTARAANVAWLSFHAGDAMPASELTALTPPETMAPDVAYTSLLTRAGHTVTRIVTTADMQNSGLAAQLNAQDLVIIGRSTNSGFFDTLGEAQFFADLTKPLIITSGYLLRDNRLGYTTGDTIPDSNTAFRLKTEVPTHPIFTGVGLDANGLMTANYNVPPVTYRGITQLGISVNTNALDGGGTLLAHTGTTDPTNSGTGTVIAEWNAGATLNPAVGSTTQAGKRMVFLTGSRETGGVPGQGAGVFDLTPVGSLLFTNAVNYMMGFSPGDLDYDHDVDLTDFAAIRDHFQQAVPNRSQGDLNLDGVVDWIDYRAWKQDFLNVTAAGGAVPEPSTCVLVTLAFAGLGQLRRRSSAD